MINQPLTACKQYCLVAGATQGNIAYTQNVIANYKETYYVNQTIDTIIRFDTYFLL